MTEIWKNIPGCEPYEASNLGQIRNGSKGNILVPVKWGSRGHLAVGVGRKTKQYVHRLVLMAFFGLPKESQIACHKNDIKTDNCLKNLYWGTYKQNTADQIRNGKFFFAIGEKNGNSKFSDETIKKIKSEYTGKRGEQTALARKYGMHVSNVHLIVHGETRVS